MKTILLIMGAFVGTFLVTSCSTIQPTDPLTDFLNRNALRISSVTSHPCDSGHNIDIQLTSTSDTNHFFYGWLMLEDLKKRPELEEKAHKEQQLREQEKQTKMLTSTNLFLTLSCMQESVGLLYDVRVLNSQRIQRHFPNCPIFRAGCLGPGLNPIFVAQPLVIGTNENGGIAGPTAYLLGNAPTVATFMNRYKQKVASIEQARELVDLFAEMQSWLICKDIPKELAGREDLNTPEWASRWTYTEKEIEPGWQFLVVFQTDPKIRSYSQYRIDNPAGIRKRKNGKRKSVAPLYCR
jgi:hypothetical protein